MILSASEFVRRLNHSSPQEKLIITPYHSSCQQPASYDLRAANDFLLPRGMCSLVPTTEWVELPKDLAGALRCRSSFGRKGILLGAGFVDPGFRGQLTLCLTNMGSEDVVLKKNDRVVQMILHEVRNNDTLYNGQYQDSLGVVEAKRS